MILNPCVYEMRFGLYIVNLAFGMLAAHYTLEKMNEVSTTIVILPASESTNGLESGFIPTIW